MPANSKNAYYSAYTQKDAGKQSSSPGSAEVEDLIHNFLIIVLEHSMRQKDGWKVNLFVSAVYQIISLSPFFQAQSFLFIVFATSDSFYRILRLQFIVQSGFLLLVGLALGRNELGNFMHYCAAFCVFLLGCQ